MKILVLPSILMLAVCFPAVAKTKKLKGTAADGFIARYLPGAVIPGPVKGTIRCYVPAMGGRSDGEVSTCTIVDY